MMAEATLALELGVSVIMPVHSGGAFLREAIESVLAQDLDAPWELVIALDRPETECVLVIESIESARIRTVDVPEAGVAHAHNAGLFAAKFDLVAVMHSDDVMLKGRLTRQMQMLRDHPNLLGVGGQIELIDDTGAFIGPARFATSPDDVRHDMSYACPIAHPASMYRTAVARQLGGYREQFAPAEDLDLWLRLLDVGDMANVASTVLRYRRHAGQLSMLRKERQAEAKYMALQAAKLRDRLGTDIAMSEWPAVLGYSEAHLKRDIRFELALDHLARARLSGRIRNAVPSLLAAFLARPIATMHHANTFIRNVVAQRTGRSSEAEDVTGGRVQA